jgi:transmembrane sensor
MTNRLWELLTLYWRNDITNEEKAELERLLLEHPDAWLRSGLMDQLSFSKKPLMDEVATAAWADKVSLEIEKMESAPVMLEQEQVTGKRRPLRITIFTLLFLVIATCLFVIYRQWGGMPDGYKLVTTDAGMKTRIRLSDGSMVWLNAGSSLKYPPKFDKQIREVFLSGEGYFDVQQHAGKPFIIHTEKMDIRVLGTAFNVRSYKDEGFTETALISGAVEILVKEANRTGRIILKPNQKLVVSDNKHIKTKNEEATIIEQSGNMVIERKALSVTGALDSGQVAETAWVRNRFLFENETLEFISRRLERWYGIKIIIEDPQLSTLRFTGRADNLSLEKLLTILQEIQPFNYSIEDDTVIIK